MAYSKSSMKATTKYMREKLDTISFRVPKEKRDLRPTKEEITNHVKKYGYTSTQQFLITAINTQISLDEKKNKK